MAKKYHKLTTNYIINRLYEKEFYYFDIRLFASLFHISHRKASQIFKHLEKRGMIKEVEREKYLLLGFQPHKVLSEPFFIGTKIVIPSYVSFWNALNFYGFTEQAPRIIFIACTKQKKEILFKGIRYKFIRISPRKFFGYHEMRSDSLIYLIAEPEKALIDSLSQPQYAGGIEEIFKCLYNAKDEIKITKLIDYAIRTKNRSLNARLGYLLNKIDIKAKKLKPYISKSFVKLDTTKKLSKVWDKEWKINVNIPNKKLFEWQEIH